MGLLEYIGSLDGEARAAFAERCETTFPFLRNVAYGSRRAGESLCINIERESGGQVTCEELRPDVDWAYLRGTKPRAKTKKAA